MKSLSHTAEEVEPKAIRLITSTCNLFFNLFWVSIPIFLILELLTHFGLIANSGTVMTIEIIARLIAFFALWCFTIKTFVHETYMFIASVRHENNDYVATSAIRYTIMLILCGIMVWINCKYVGMYPAYLFTDM